MSSRDDRKRMIDDGFVFLIDRARTAIREVEPTALVTMGFFHDTEPNLARRGDPRLVRTRAVIERSTADFIDIHPYPDDELTFPQFMQNYGIDGPVVKPIIIGEFGGSKRAYVSASQAADALVSWQRQSCAYGIDGGCSGRGTRSNSPTSGTGSTRTGRSSARYRRAIVRTPAHKDPQETSRTSASEIAAMSASVPTGNTACGVPAAHQTVSNRRRDESTTVRTGRSCPTGGTPPIANPVASPRPSSCRRSRNRRA